MLTRVSGDTGQLQKCLTLSGDLVKEPVTSSGTFPGAVPPGLAVDADGDGVCARA